MPQYPTSPATTPASAPSCSTSSPTTSLLDLTDGGGKPSERTFRSTTTITLRGHAAGRVDLRRRHRRHRPPGHPQRHRRRHRRTTHRPTASCCPTSPRDNIVVVDADLLYTNTGEGLHRFVDPLDGEVYLYSQFETADAKRMYACFDQPDLKATFTFHVTAPEHWEVISNGRRTARRATSTPARPCTSRPRPGSARTSPRSSPARTTSSATTTTASTSACAAAGRSPSTSTPTKLFTVTKQGFDWYHANFGVRYPFDKYDQLFVPEFNAGAMENAGCVTFREDYVFRSKVTDARYERRGETILHEMAHMWFGDLVTMRWWDDLWLNESFADLRLDAVPDRGDPLDATPGRPSPTSRRPGPTGRTSCRRRTRSPPTRPTSQTAEVNFDGITYAKGASVLKQLGAYVGVEAFLAGLRAVLRRARLRQHHAGRPARARSRRPPAATSASGRSCGSRRPASTRCGRSSRSTTTATTPRFDLVQTRADRGRPRRTSLRPHRLAIGLYDDDADERQLVRTGRVELDVTGERTAVAELVGVPQPALLLVNDDDLTYCKLRLDERSLAHPARRRHRATGRVAAARAVLVRRVGHDARRRARRPATTSRWSSPARRTETDIGVMQSLTRQALRALRDLRRPGLGAAGLSRWPTTARHRAAGGRARLGPPAGLGARAARRGPQSDEHIADDPRGLLDGDHRAAGPGRRRRAALGDRADAVGARRRRPTTEIDAELERDPSAAGQRHAATARALLPTAPAKAEAWRLAVDDDTLPNAMQEAAIVGFARTVQASCSRRTSRGTSPTSPGCGSGAPASSRRTWSSGCSRPGRRRSATTRCGGRRLPRRTDVPSALRRLVSEGRADIVRALAARAADARIFPRDH